MRPTLIAIALASVASAAVENNNDKRQFSILPIVKTTVIDGKTTTVLPGIPVISKTGDNPTYPVTPTATTTVTAPTSIVTPTTPGEGGGTTTVGHGGSTIDDGNGGTVTKTHTAGGTESSSAPSSTSTGDAAAMATPIAGALFAALGVAMAL